MPPNRFESEVESFLEGSHGDRTHIKRADHHTVTPLCGTLLTAACVAAVVVVCCAPLSATAPVGVLCGRVPVVVRCTCCVALHPLRGAAPVVGRCTCCGALHPLWSAAPEQKGCNADGSGVAQSRTRKGAVSVGESVSNCDEDRNAMRGFHSPSLVLSVIHSG